jgi:hypothetical protein
MIQYDEADVMIAAVPRPPSHRSDRRVLRAEGDVAP